MNYTVKMEGVHNDYYCHHFDSETEARKYARKLKTLNGYESGRRVANAIVIYKWADNDSTMTEIHRIDLKAI